MREIIRFIRAERVVGEAMLEKAPVKISSRCENRFGEIDGVAIGNLFDLLWADIYHAGSARKKILDVHDERPFAPPSNAREEAF